VAIAGGRFKARAIRAVLESGHLSGLITDEKTASILMKAD
jgi:DNA-binding transcriptional regulator LsrR (DeoR family)